MPWRQSDPGVGLVTENPEPIQRTPPPEMVGMDIANAALRQSNSAVSVIQAMQHSFFPETPGYNAYDDIRGTRFEDDYGWRFLGSRSQEQTNAIKSQIQQEETDKKTLEDAGKVGWVATMLAGLADPTMLLPGGVGIEATKSGLTFGQTALKLGYASAAQMALQETAFQASQQTRPLSESLLNVASGTLMGAFLGAGAVKFATAAEATAIERGLDRERALLNAHAGNPPLPFENRPTLERIEGAPNGYFVRSSQNRDDFLTLTRQPDAVKLSVATVGAERRGQGVGRALYERALQFAADEGVPLRSDISVSNDAIRIYDKLRAVGYDVKEAEGTTTTKSGKANAKAGYVYEVTDPHGVGPRRAAEGLPEPEAVPLAPVEQGLGVPLPAGAGAAAVDTRKLELVPIFGQRITENAKALTSLVEQVPVVGGMTARALRAVPNLIYKTDPLARIFLSQSLTARRAAADAFETALRFKDNLLGLPTVLGGGGALSRLAKQHISTTRSKVGQFLDEQWKDMAEGKVPLLAKEREALTGASALGPDKPTYEQFAQEVSRAMRRDDKHDIPQVQKSAEFIRKTVFDPLLKRAQDVGYIPKDVETKTAQSYLMRIYDKQKIMAQRPEFANKIVDWLKGQQNDKQAAQGRLEALNDNLKSLNSRQRQIQAAIDRNEETQKALNTRLSERGMEAARAEKRAGGLEELASSIAEEISEAKDFVRAMRQEIQDPALLKRLDQMQADVTELERQNRPMTEAQLQRLEDEEVKGALRGPYRAAAEMLVGRRKLAKVPSFLNWLVANGGLKDEGGELAAMDVRSGVINAARGHTFHEIGEKLQSEFPGAFPIREETGHGMPERNDILNWISEASRGHEPGWWMENLPGADRDALESAHIAATLDELFSRAGVQVKSVKDVGKILRDEFSQSVNLRDLDKIAADMEAAGQSVPAAIRHKGAADELAAAREDVAKVRQLIASAQAGNAARAKRLATTDIKAGEAALAERANMGRLGILQERLDRHEGRRELLDDASEILQRHQDEIRDRMEEEALKWQGDSSVEAKMALRARGKAEEATDRGERMPEARRLKTADDAVDRFVRKVIGSDEYNLSDPELRDLSHEIIDRIQGSPDGRLNYDMDTGGPHIGFTGEHIEGKRGPELARTFGIPDLQIEDFLENNIEHITNAYLRTMVPDVLLGERFGDPLMTNEFRKINEEYARLIDAEPDQGKRVELANEQRQVVRDLAGSRDIFRGVYGYPMYNQMPMLARTAAVVKNLNVPASLGMSAISSIPDLGNVMSRFGALTVMKDAYLPLINSLAKGDFALTNEVKRQFQAMAIIIEMEQASRAHSLSDTLTMMHPKSRVERTSQYVADKFQLVNAQAPWTDFAKAVNGIVAMTELHRMSERWVQGTITAREKAILAENGIDIKLADKIVQQYATHGNEVSGVRLSNTGEWTDAEAKSAFESAIGREVDIGVVTPGFEKPLMMSNPVFSVLSQFKSFTAGANSRILIANLQRADAQTMGGVTGMLALGMVSYKIGSLLSGQATSDNPADWVKEGMARSNILGWLEEANQMSAKATRGQVDAYRLIGTQKPLSRYAGRSAVDQLLGPTFGKLESVQQITGALASRDWNENDTHAVRRLLAFQNVAYLRQMYDAIERGANGAFGIPMRQRD